VPDGLAYHAIDNLYLLNFLSKEYNWDKISLMGHSMGAILSFMYATVFPSKVDMLIQIDALKPQVYDPVKVAESLEDRIANFMLADQRNQEKSEPPAYTFEDMVERMTTGTYGSVTKETAQYLLKRNIKKSEKFPGKFYFTRDSRLKHNFPSNFQQAVTCELSKRLKMPHIFIKALNAPYWEKREYFNEVLDILKENPNFENHVVDSTHHLHLTEPEKIAPLITSFIEKHDKVGSKL
jgi:pimeloyl-ACP methyl ester carboxylesterase